MPPDQWREILEIYEAALELTGREQPAFLDRACADRPQLRAEVDSLLAAGDHIGEFLERSPAIAGIDVPGLLICGQVIGHRIGPYQITKAIGEGGMAVVYEAVRMDGQFEHRVAVKMVKPGLLPDTVVDRFRAERQILAGLRHPNIAQLLDGGVSDGVPYFILELVDGKHIDEYCSQLSMERKIALFRQVCDAVQYAHGKGVIHRDIKPGNILIGEEGVPKLLDFGIAKVLQEGLEQASTRTVDRMATPNYASPEQLAGRHITAQADVYSLGILLYELIAGRLSLPLERPSVAARNAGVVLPARFAKALDLVIMKAMHEDPAQRYRTAQDLSLDAQRILDGAPVQARGDAVVYTARKFARRQRMFLAGVFALVLGVIASAASLWHWRRTTYPAERKSIAVVGFQNLSGGHASDWLSTALAEMFTTELAANTRLRVVPGDRVARAKRDLGITEVDTGNIGQLTRLRLNVDAQYLLTGSYLSGGSDAQSLRLYVKLQDAKSGEILVASTGNGFENELPAVVFRSAGQLQHQLGLEIPAKQPSLVYPSDPRAARLYAEALAEERMGNARSARKMFEDALVIEPGSPLIRSSYASTLNALGHDRMAMEQAKLSLGSKSGLSPELRMLLEGRYHEYATEWKKAVESYRILWSSFYDNIDYGILLAHAQNRASLPDEALKTLKTLDLTMEAVRADPRGIVEEANAYFYKADYAAMEGAALRARQRAEKLGARAWVADSYLLEGAALTNENKYAQAITAYSTAQRLYTDLKDEFGSANASKGIGVANSEQGNYALAEKYYSEALKTYSKLGFRRGEAATLSNLSVVKKLQSDFPAALKLMEQCMAVQMEIGDKLSLSHSLLNYGSTLRRLNSLPEAKEALTRSLRLARELGDPEQIVRVLVMLGDTELDAGELIGAEAQEEEALAVHTRPGATPRVRALVLQHLALAKQSMGRLAEAKADYQASLDIGRKSNLKNLVSDNLVMLSGAYRQQWDLDGSNKLLREADEIYQKGPQREGSLDVQLARANNDLAANQLEGLRERLDRCIAGFHDLGLIADESDASLSLAEFWLRQSKPAQAAAALPVSEIPRFALRMRREIVAQRIISAQGKPREAVVHLKALSASLEAKKWMGLSLEARLAWTEAELTFNKAAGQNDAAALKQDTGTLGFGLMARTASALH